MLPMGRTSFQLHCLRKFSHTRLQGISQHSLLSNKSNISSYHTCERLNQYSLHCSNLRTPCLAPTTQLPGLTCFRWKQTKAQEQQGLGNVQSKEYMELYFIKNISFLRVLCRFSKLSILMFLFATPASIISTQLGLLSTSSSTNIIVIFAGYAILFTTQSWLYSSRIVGKIMMSSDEEVVKVSHLSLFGDRRDVFCRPSDFVPLGKERSGGFLGQNLCQMQIKSYPKRLLYMPDQGHSDTDYERIELLLSGEYSESKES